MKLRYRIKIQILSLFICLFIEVKSHGQEFIGGFLINPNISLFFGAEPMFLNSKNYLAMSAGIFVQKKFHERIYTTFEMRYAQKGNAYNEKDDSEVGVRLNYMVIPLLVGYDFTISNRNYMIEFGLGYGILINSKIRYNNVNNHEEIRDFKDEDICMILSLKTPVNKKKNLLMGIRISNGDLTYQVHNVKYVSTCVYGAEIDYLIF